MTPAQSDAYLRDDIRESAEVTRIAGAELD
jgi:hypothetical protein